MKNIKLFSFIFIFLMFGFLFGQNFAQAQTAETEANTTTEVSAEYSLDQIASEDLEITDDEVKIPGEKGYWWSNLKSNLQSTFTFSPAKKAELEIKKANLELLVAQKLATVKDDSASQEKLQKALENFKAKMASAEKRLEKLDSEKKEVLLEKLDKYNLKQQQLLRDIEPKLSEEGQEKIIELRKERVKLWYENHKENLEERLEQAVNNDTDGSKFKALNTLASLEEIKESLPTEAQGKLQSAIIQAQERLQTRTQNLSEEEKNKFADYFENLNINSVQKIELIEKLKNSQLNSGVKTRIEQIKNNEVEKIEIEFESFDDNAKAKFLEKTFDGDAANATRIEMLKKLEQRATENVKERIQSLNEEQELKIKERIKNSQNSTELEIIQKENKNLPVMNKEIQEKKNDLLKKEQEAKREMDKQSLEKQKNIEKQKQEALKKQRERERENRNSTDNNENDEE